MVRKLHHPDYILIFLVSLLMVFGLLILTSATSIVGFEKFQDTYYFVKRQLFLGIVPGVFIAYILSRVPYQWLRKITTPFFIFSIILLLLVFIPQISGTYNSAHSWIRIGSFSFQPGEIMKLALILLLAYWLSSQGISSIHRIRTLLLFSVLLGIVGALFIAQPDIGTLVVTLAIAGSILYFALARPLHLGILALISIVTFGILVLIAPYRINRLINFLHPAQDAQGTGYQINQALLAVGSGGWWGRGLGASRQKFTYLPEVSADSIFGVIAEEMGFIISILLVLVILWILFRLLRIARYAPDGYGRLIAVGVMTWIGVQSFLNIGAMVGVLPLTGLPLPFISHGGTAILVLLSAMGILVNISKQTRLELRGI